MWTTVDLGNSVIPTFPWKDIMTHLWYHGNFKMSFLVTHMHMCSEITDLPQYVKITYVCVVFVFVFKIWNMLIFVCSNFSMGAVKASICYVYL